MVEKKSFFGFLFVFFAVFPASHIYANTDTLLVQYEQRLAVLMNRISKTESYAVRDSLNTRFLHLFHEALSVPNSFTYPFDSLNHIGRLRSRDNRVRVITWQIPRPGGYHAYFGFIQVRRSNGQVLLHRLTVGNDTLPDFQHARLSTDRWYGAIYYRIIDFKSGSTTRYLLLGFDYHNLFTSKKLIEVLSVDSQGEVALGFPIFNVDNRIRLSRIVFEFSARVVHTLRYIDDGQLVVFDHLAPSKPEFSGDPQFYGPDGSFDGFRYQNGEWVYVRDLDLRNPKRNRRKVVEPPVNIDAPGFLYRGNGANG